MLLKRVNKICFLVAAFAVCLICESAFAQIAQIQGPADAGRIKPEEKILVPAEDSGLGATVPADEDPSSEVPEAVKKVNLVLKEVKVEGMTAFTDTDIKHIYEPYIDKEISLGKVWEMASEITSLYRDQGYLLVRAYVPAQSIKNGVVQINVVEGYIGSIEIESKYADKRIIRKYIKRLTSEKPVKSQSIERFLLQLNDLPGVSFKGVLTQWQEKDNENAVKMVLVAEDKKGKGTVKFDNMGSRFLGPHEVALGYQTALLPFQLTSFTFSTSIPTDELKYGAIKHEVYLAPDVTLQFDLSKVKAQPGYNLRDFDINSDSVFLSSGLGYQLIRQRQENLSMKLSIDARDSDSELLNVPFTNDHIRALRAGFNYDKTDSWGGSDVASLTISQGLDAIGSSERGDNNLSRAQAVPNFTKAEMQFQTLQAINNTWSVFGAVSGQISDDALYSAEEFGYGGFAFGKAFDSSEITGDSGVAGSIEFRYNKMVNTKPVGIMPYVFYDAGMVWNKDSGILKKRQFGSSAGIGTNLLLPRNTSGNIAVAFPLSRDVSTPIYGNNDSGPRLLFQILNEF